MWPYCAVFYMIRMIWYYSKNILYFGTGSGASVRSNQRAVLEYIRFASAWPLWHSTPRGAPLALRRCSVRGPSLCRTNCGARGFMLPCHAPSEDAPSACWRRPLPWAWFQQLEATYISRQYYYPRFRWRTSSAKTQKDMKWFWSPSQTQASETDTQKVTSCRCRASSLPPPLPVPCHPANFLVEGEPVKKPSRRKDT